ncbi:MAG: YtxH domain-containing protein [Anaerolineaceae bacterium]|nr:YtxH domain-containing protein [Anaerolineaceae bacterium]
MAERDEFGAFLVGFIIGGLTGAVTALLLAPQSGEQTRTIIKEKSIELRDRTTESIDEAYAQAEHAAIEAKSRFDKLAVTTKEKATEVRQRGKLLLEEQKAKFSKLDAEEQAEVDPPSEAEATAEA